MAEFYQTPGWFIYSHAPDQNSVVLLSDQRCRLSHPPSLSETYPLPCTNVSDYRQNTIHVVNAINILPHSLLLGPMNWCVAILGIELSCRIMFSGSIPSPGPLDVTFLLLLLLMLTFYDVCEFLVVSRCRLDHSYHDSDV